MISEVTLKTIENGLLDNDGWVRRGVCVLADHPAAGVLDRRKFQEYRDELRSFGRIEEMDEARKLCIIYAAALLQIATAPSYDFRGKTFVLTGKLENFTRNELTTKLESLGAFLTSSVSRNTDILVVGSKPGWKFQVAQRYGVPMWTEDELLENMKPKSQKK